MLRYAKISPFFMSEGHDIPTAVRAAGEPPLAVRVFPVGLTGGKFLLVLFRGFPLSARGCIICITATGKSKSPPFCSPVCAPDEMLVGFLPRLMITGVCDDLCSEAEKYAVRLRDIPSLSIAGRDMRSLLR